MEILRAIKIDQSGLRLFLTSLSTDQVKRLRSAQQLEIETFDPNKPPSVQGYQRSLDPRKIQQISAFISRHRDDPGADVLLPILPSALVLNCRTGGGLRYEDSSAELALTERDILYVVDGQHRIEGVLLSDLPHEYDIPTVIIDGLNIVQEAAQFLTINSKQTRVRPDLQLRVLYNFDRVNTQRLVDVLKIDDWKLEAQALAIALNDHNESRWRNMIKRPNDTLQGWRPMREAGFIDTLKIVADPNGPLRRIHVSSKSDFLIEYWDAIRRLYPPAFNEETGRNYHICRTFGAGTFNALSTVVFHLRSLYPRKSVLDLLRPVAKKWPLRKWARRTGDFHSEAGRQSNYGNWANRFAKALEPQFNIVDETALRRLQRRSLAPSDMKSLERAERLLQPLFLRPFDGNQTSEVGQRGCYVLLRWGRSPKAYIGQADNLGQRLSQHEHLDLYSVQTVSSERGRDTLEMALYHVLAADLRQNVVHPPPTSNCPYC